MHQKLILVLSTIAILVYAQDQCDCDLLSTCVSNKRLELENEFSACNQNCKKKLGDEADDVQACFQNKKKRLVQYEDWIQSCVFSEQSEVCGGVPPQIQTNKTNVQRRELEIWRRVSEQMDDSLLLYKACMKQCFLDKQLEHKQERQKSQGAAGCSTGKTGGPKSKTGGSNGTAGGWNDTVGGWNDTTGQWNQTVGGSNSTVGGWNDTTGGWNDTVGGLNGTVGGSNGTVGGSNGTVGGSIAKVGSGKKRQRRRLDTSLLKKCAAEQDCIIYNEDEMAAVKNCKARSGLTEKFHQEVKTELCECLSKAYGIDLSKISCDQQADQEIEEKYIIVFRH